MKTEIKPAGAQSIKEAAALIKNGALVAFPTETVYGLGANALNGRAVKHIYEVKGRPSDNPLIVHVSSLEQMKSLCKTFPEQAQKLFDAFMPGPITVVLPKSDIIPKEISGGLDTVALRLPENEVARELISQAGVPIAAPSANLSGSPSPTTAQHVYDDLSGRIPLILDGGPCRVGVESTVITLCTNPPTLLRPGGITLEQLRAVLGEVAVHPSVLDGVKLDKVASPGMKYKHYSPKARVVIAMGEDMTKAINTLYDKAVAKGVRVCIFCREDRIPLYSPRTALPLYTPKDPELAAHNLFALLREADEKGVNLIVAESLPKEGIGLSVMNRLLRAAAFTTFTLESVNDIKLD